jgi:two-component system, cell cycle response regulator DivK
VTRRTVLVVEDFEDNRAILRDLLTYAGYDVVEAADGEAGVSKARAIRPDLIVMDLQLPVLDGYEATRLIRRQAGLGAVPIIAVTSFALPGDEEKARGAGCDHYVTKPFSPRELLATIRNFLGEGASGGP